MHSFFLKPDIPTQILRETIIDLAFASKEVRLCNFLESEYIGSDHYLQLWSLDVTSSAKDSGMEPHLEFKTLGGDFNFKDAHWDHFSNLMAKSSMNLKHDMIIYKGKA